MSDPEFTVSDKDPAELGAAYRFAIVAPADGWPRIVVRHLSSGSSMYLLYKSERAARTMLSRVQRSFPLAELWLA